LKRRNDKRPKKDLNTLKRKTGKLSLFFFIIILLATLLGAELAHDSVQPKLLDVTAAIPKNFPPHYAVDKDGKLIGFAIDVMDWVSAAAGLKVTYLIMDSWTDVEGAVRSGRADLIPNIGITAPRMAWLDYTSPVETFSVSVFVRTHTDDIKGADDLTGHTVAVVKFNVGVDLLKDRKDIDLKIFPDASDAAFNLLAGHVDALVYPVPVLLKMVQEAGVDHRIKTVGEPLLEIKRAVGVRKGKKELLQKLDQAVNRFVSTPEYQRIYVKWFGKPRPFWTISKVLCVMSGAVLSIFILMALWRYHSVSRLNRQLTCTNTDLRRVEKELRNVNRALRVLSACNQAMIRATAEPDLLREICRVIVEESEYRLAWIGYAEQDESKTVRPVAQWGYEDGYLEALHITWDETERGSSPVGTAIRTHKACICRDILNDSRFSPWREEAAERGYASLISLPLITNGQCIGALTVHAAETDAFGSEEEKLLTELANDLAFGIGALHNRAERERAEREVEKFVALVEQSGEFIGITTLEGKLLYLNDAGQRLVGLESIEEALAKTLFDFVMEEDLDDIKERILPSILRDGWWQGEYSLKHFKSGRPIPVEMNDFLIRDSDTDQPIAMATVSRDITERKNQERELRESEERYRTLFDSAADIIAVVDTEGTILDLSKKFEQESGYSSEEMRGKDIVSSGILTEPSATLALSYLKRLLSGEQLPTFEVEGVRKDGGIIPYELSAVTIKKDAEVVAVQAILRNITSRKQAETQLNETKVLLETIINSIPDVIGLQDADHKVIRYNEAGYRLLNMDLEGVRGKRCYELIGKNAPCSICATSEVYQTRRPASVERYEEALGMWVDVRAYPILDESGKLVNVVEHLRDITEVKRAEKDLQREKEKFRVLVEESPLGISLIGKDGSYQYINPKFVEMFGYTLEDIPTGREWFRKAFPDSGHRKQAISSWVSDLDKSKVGEFRHATFTVRCKDGSEKVIQFLPVTMETGDQFVVHEDITERKQAEEKIRDYSENLERMVEERTRELNQALYDTEEARDRIDGILKSIADGLIVTDLYNRIILMNRAAEDLLRVRLSEVIDRPIEFAIDDRTLRERIKNTLDKKQEGYEFDFELPEDGAEHPRIIRARTSMIKGKTGKHTGIITIMHDVTHEREVDRMKTEFISTTAHELRTPLTSIRGFSEILMRRDDIKRKERMKFLTYINDQSVNLTNIINDLLDISRIESGLGFSLKKAPCDIAEIIRVVIQEFQERPSRYRFEVMLPEEPVEMKADRDKVEQVLQNIISNAVKYSPEGSLIQVKGVVKEDQYEVSVDDQGIGMTSEQVAKVFEKFYRADASNTAIPGTGLGMSIVKYLVEAHGGEVWVESQKGKGTTVRFTIPLKKNISPNHALKMRRGRK
jgi:PAS domain S-box-containing protein